jgi:arsenate reductase-like glutaredoxin family protein
MQTTQKRNGLIYILLIVLGLITIGLFQRCPREKTPATVEKHQDSINVSKDKIKQYEAQEIAKDSEILALQNQLQKISVDFSNYKKTPLYKERIKEIIRTVPIDTLASNTIELEVCREKSIIKDTIINAYVKKDTLFSLQKNEFQNIIDNQNKIIDIHVNEILQEQKRTKKERFNKNFWKVTTAVIGGAFIYQTVK